VNIYADSSAVVKVYIDEAGSERMRDIVFSEENHIFISKITGAEVAAAFSRRKRMNDIAEDDYNQIFSDFLSDFEELFVRSEVTDSIVSRAIELTKTRTLRGYDAVQLATALTLSTEIEDKMIFISADGDLNDAAKAEGLTVEDL
jgi:hypothetical protein